MRFLFRGWRREVLKHRHDVRPVRFNGREFLCVPGAESVVWHGGLKAYGKLDGVALNGDFLVEFEFDQKELENWILKFADEHPEQAIKILSNAHAEALIALHKRVVSPGGAQPTAAIPQ